MSDRFVVRRLDVGDRPLLWRMGPRLPVLTCPCCGGFNCAFLSGAPGCGRKWYPPAPTEPEPEPEPPAPAAAARPRRVACWLFLPLRSARRRRAFLVPPALRGPLARPVLFLQMARPAPAGRAALAIAA